MSHPPEHIPDIENESPVKVKSPNEKEKKDKQEKEKVGVKFYNCLLLIFYTKLFTVAFMQNISLLGKAVASDLRPQ